MCEELRVLIRNAGVVNEQKSKIFWAGKRFPIRFPVDGN
jgi:hypothetical protein